MLCYVMIPQYFPKKEVEPNDLEKSEIKCETWNNIFMPPWTTLELVIVVEFHHLHKIVSL
jgi:hypothetical protein